MSKPYKKFKEVATYNCSKCGLADWLGEPITLEVDHIDGNNRNNDISNLRYLCPNCHSQTPTWRGRNKNKGSSIVTDEALMQALLDSKNIRQALIKVGLTPKGGNYNRASKLLPKVETRDTKNSQYGTIWVNDGKVNKKIKRGYLPDYESCGFAVGRLMFYQKPPSQKGKVWVTNGSENKIVLITNIPDGFWRGKTMKKSPGDTN